MKYDNDKFIKEEGKKKNDNGDNNSRDSERKLRNDTRLMPTYLHNHHNNHHIDVCLHYIVLITDAF